MNPRLRTLRRALCVATAVAATFVVPLASMAATVVSTSYVALGDSYSAGVGAGNVIASSGGCTRSSSAYSALWAAAHPTTSYVSVACSGASTLDVISAQVAALGPGTALVSVTMGGNDVGFSDVMRTCVLSSSATCVSAVTTAENLMTTILPGRLDAALAAIRSHAPAAHVVVLDYPHLYDLSHSWYCPGLSGAARTALNQAADKLDAAIQAAATRAGASFAEVKAKFQGHELCDWDDWLHAVNVTNVGESYHPTATGQSSGYYAIFSSFAP